MCAAASSEHWFLTDEEHQAFLDARKLSTPLTPAVTNASTEPVYSQRLKDLSDKKNWEGLHSAIQTKARLNKFAGKITADELRRANEAFEIDDNLIDEIDNALSVMFENSLAQDTGIVHEQFYRHHAKRLHEEATKQFNLELEKISELASCEEEFTARALLLEPVPSERTFRRRLRNAIDRSREHFAKSIKTVGIGGSSYVSEIGYKTKQNQLKTNREYLEKCSVTCKTRYGNDEQVSLLTIADNAAKAKKAESYGMLKGLEKYATKNNLIMGFLTVTLDSVWHANPEYGFQTGKCWNRKTTREAHDVLQEQWKLIRAKCAKDNIVLSGGKATSPKI